MKKILFAIGLLSSIMPAANAQVNLVYDFNSGSGDGNPIYITPYNDKLTMVANDGTHGRELWVYDGVSAPTMVQDLYPGAADMVSLVYNQKNAVIGNTLYFTADDGTKGVELYKYNGTSISLAADIEAGSGSSAPSSLIVLNNVLYFCATTTANGSELWKYDPATSAATRITDIATGSASGLQPSFPMGTFNGKLYFTANDQTTGQELWVYDPATNNTTQVADLVAGSGSSTPFSFQVAGGKMYFIATTDGVNFNLYAYDGTTPPARVASGAGVSTAYLSPITALNGNILFYGSADGMNYELYKYNSSANTMTVAATIGTTGNSGVNYLTAYNGKAYFSATDGTHGEEIWTYNDTVATMVADLNPGSGNSTPSDFQGWNGYMYVNASSGTAGFELYRIAAPDNSTTPSGIQAVSFTGAVKVYPNPADGDAQIALTLQQPQALTIKVTDMLGRDIFTTGLTSYPANTTVVTVPLAGAAAGSYCYNVYNEAGKLQANGVMVRK